jgi:hypothetical protein
MGSRYTHCAFACLLGWLSSFFWYPAPHARTHATGVICGMCAQNRYTLGKVCSRRGVFLLPPAPRHTHARVWPKTPEPLVFFFAFSWHTKLHRWCARPADSSACSGKINSPRTGGIGAGGNGPETGGGGGHRPSTSVNCQ